MNYPIAIHKDKTSDYGVSVPDLPGCFSAGSTLDEAVAMAREAIELHLEGLIEDGQPIPPAQPIERHRTNADYADAQVWALVQVDPSNLPQKAVRLNITMPKRVLERVDRYAEETGDTRSGLLVRAVTSLIASKGQEPTKWSRPVKARRSGAKKQR
jgi:predicted RNase H-like HicB family nuclease